VKECVARAGRERGEDRGGAVGLRFSGITNKSLSNPFISLSKSRDDMVSPHTSDVRPSNGDR
jgi:hypothetical protein